MNRKRRLERLVRRRRIFQFENREQRKRSLVDGDPFLSYDAMPCSNRLFSIVFIGERSTNSVLKALEEL